MRVESKKRYKDGAVEQVGRGEAETNAISTQTVFGSSRLFSKKVKYAL